MGDDLNNEELEALTTVKMGSLRKKINAESWNSNMESLIKAWGEKSAGLRFMHSNSSSKWKAFSNTLTLWSIGVTTIASGVSLISASIDNEEAKNIVLYVVGAIGIGSSLLQSLKKFYNAEEKAADHNAVSRQFGSFYRYITLQLGQTREDRLPSDQLSEYVLKEYERLMQESPPLGGDQIELFKKTFKNSKQSVPDICETDFIINIYNPGVSTILEKDVLIDSPKEEINSNSSDDLPSLE
tara:strand:- start:177 stop:899 length:723 start_codon:yes stop_codon:yes gene_type:complete